MRADRVELSWDASKSNWLLRIEAGEVIRRHCALPRQNFEDRKCLAEQRTSFVEHPDAIFFLWISPR